MTQRISDRRGTSCPFVRVIVLGLSMTLTWGACGSGDEGGARSEPSDGAGAATAQEGDAVSAPADPPEGTEGSDVPFVIEKDDAGFLTFDFPKDGLDFEEFVKEASRATGREFVYDVRRIATKSFNMIGTKRVHEGDFFKFLQVLFFAHDMAVVPIGPPDAEVLLIEDIKTSSSSGSRAVFVPVDELEKRRHNAGEIIAASFPLKHITPAQAKNGIQSFFPKDRWSFAQPIEESNSLLVNGFAPKLWKVYLEIKKLDVPGVDQAR